MTSELLPPKLDKLRERAALARARELEARAEAERLERKLRKRAAKLGLEIPIATSGSLGRTETTAPTGVAAIRALVLVEPERVWSAGDIQACLEERGWVSDGAKHRRQGIEAAISRLVRAGELQRVARGRYCVDRGTT